MEKSFWEVWEETELSFSCGTHLQKHTVAQGHWESVLLMWQCVIDN